MGVESKNLKDFGFCEVCGRKCIGVEYNPKRFSRLNGKRLLKPICPVGVCGHTGVYHDYVPNPRRRKGIFSFMDINDLVCTKCGKYDCYCPLP